jgi:anti-sigma B factor antagonist
MSVGELKINRETLEEARIEVLRLGGGIDAHTFEQLDTAIDDIFYEGSYNIIIDMSEVEYISSAGVGTLVSATHQAEQKGGHVVLMEANERVTEVLRVLGLLTSLKVVRDLKAALAFY